MKKNLWKRRSLRQSGPDNLGSLLEHCIAAPKQQIGSLSLIPLLVPPGIGHRSLATFKELRWESSPQLRLRNDSAFPAIVPMQLAYLEYGLPSQAVCEAMILRPESQLDLRDAASLSPPDASWNLMLPDQMIAMPHQLRRSLWASCGERSISKLWPTILRFQHSLQWDSGEITPEQKRQCAERVILLRQNFVLLPEQLGYLLYWNGQLIGIELGPSHDWWKEWFPRLRDYGLVPMSFAPNFEVPDLQARPRKIMSLAQQKREFEAETRLAQQKAQFQLSFMGEYDLQLRSRQQDKGLRLYDLEHPDLRGQAIIREGGCCYLSMFAPSLLQV